MPHHPKDALELCEMGKYTGCFYRRDKNGGRDVIGISGRRLCGYGCIEIMRPYPHKRETTTTQERNETMNKIKKAEYHAINTTEKADNTNYIFRVKCEGVDGWCLIKAAVDLGYIPEDFRRFENYHKRTAAAILLPEVLTAAGLPVPDSVQAAAAAAQKANDEKRREGLKKQFATYKRGEFAFKADKAAAAAKSWSALRRRCLDMVETAAIVAEVDTEAAGE